MDRRARELYICQRLADAINERDGTDYRAQAPREDPPDGLLVSESGGHPEIRVEVVSAPREGDTDQLVNDQRDDILKAQARLQDAMREARLDDVHLDVGLQDGVVPGRLTGGDVSRIIDFARTCPLNDGVGITDTEVCDFDESLSERVVHVSVYRVAGLGGPVADIPLGAWIPHDGEWIRGAVEHKRERYSGAYAATLVLAVDTAMLIHGRQITAFAEECREADYPFREIWIVPRAGDVMQVSPPEK